MSGFPKPSATLSGRVILAGVSLGALAATAISTAAFHGSSRVGPRPAIHLSMEANGTSALRPATVVRTLACTKLPDIPGKSITTAIVAFPPNAFSPEHHHPGSVTAYVLRGTVRSQLGGEPIRTYSVGQTWFEPPGVVHRFAENASATEPAEILATFVTDLDCGPLTIFH